MIERSLSAYLLAAPRVAALIGTSIYGTASPQGVPTPYVVYHRVSGDHEHHLRSSSGVVNCRIQIDAYADTYADSKAIGEALRLTLDGYRGQWQFDFVQSCRLMSDEDSYSEPQHGEGAVTFVFSSDYSIWSVESVPITV